MCKSEVCIGKKRFDTKCFALVVLSVNGTSLCAPPFSMVTLSPMLVHPPNSSRYIHNIDWMHILSIEKTGLRKKGV